MITIQNLGKQFQNETQISYRDITFETGKSYMLLGASGIVYMLIFLASTSGSRPGEIPLTLVAVAVLYLTQEILGGLFTGSDISHLTHIVGGICGAVMGLFRHR